jgi:peroxiredoxin
MLNVGRSAPSFELPDADLNLVRLSDFRGTQNVVLYFYPNDDTPGCTMEAIDFSELQDDFADLDTVVIGVSRDDCFTHGAFRDKHGLSVYLLADTDAEVCEPYGVMPGSRSRRQGQEALSSALDVHHRQARRATPRLLWRDPAPARRRSTQPYQGT